MGQTAVQVECLSLFLQLAFCASAVADPDFELRWRPGFGLLALPAFLPSVISSFFTQNKGGGGGAAGGLRGPLP